MKDIYTELVVPIAPNPKDKVFKPLYVCLLVILGFLTLWFNVVFLIPAIIFAVSLYRVIQREYQEFEYVHTNELFDVDMVVRNKKRRSIASILLSDVLVVAPADSDEIGNYVTVKELDYSGGSGVFPVYQVICRMDGKSVKVLLSLNSAMLNSLRQWIPDRIK